LNIDQQLASITTKLQLLLKQHRMLQKENEQLKKELEKSQTFIQAKNENLATLQQQIDVLKLGVSGWNEAEKTALAKRVDVYLKEIEKCLTLLNA
jgi:cell division septum initiation protein DivIVA